MLTLSNISKVHQSSQVQTTALNCIDLSITAGEYVAITGPSGCGKSTLLSLLGLLDVPTSGAYWFEGKDVAGWNEAKLNSLRCGRIGFIFQSFNLIEELTAFENVALALSYGAVPVKARKARVHAMLDRLGIAHRAAHHPSQLSGGQQQRVAIARALVCEPALLLADEPTGNLDSAHGDEVMELLRAINAKGTTVVMVTHSPVHAAKAGRTVHLLDGSIVRDELRSAA